jgi:hypothetical protein
MHELSIRKAGRKAYEKGEITRRCSHGSSEVRPLPPDNEWRGSVTTHPYRSLNYAPVPALVAARRPELAGSDHVKSHNHLIIPSSISSEHDPPSSCALMLPLLRLPLGLSYELGLAVVACTWE